VEMTGTYGPALHPVAFVAGATGDWKIDSVRAVRGDSLGLADRLAVHLGGGAATNRGAWTLRGVAGHVRYVERAEHDRLKGVSPVLGRPRATRGALIPIRKSSAWWALSQDERREIFEGRSRHIADSMPYLPRIARRLYHARDLGEAFDFLTWFEFAPEDAPAFEDLVEMLRSREEWSFVDREVDLRLSR
jgi:Chlorite dismutase